MKPSITTNYFILGFKMLWHPKLRHFVIIPLVINILLMMLLLFTGIHYFSIFIHAVQRHLPTWLEWLVDILWGFFAVTYVLIISATFSILSNLISAPFNASLAAKVQQIMTGNNPLADDSFAATIADIPRCIGRAGKSILYYLPRALLCFILLFIPLLHLIVPIMWFIFNAWMMVIQYMDYPMDNNRRSFNQMLKQLRTKKGVSLHFGTSVLLGTMIPIINLIVMPAAVIGATLLWLDHYQEMSKAIAH